jgi:hypothetical protein
VYPGDDEPLAGSESTFRARVTGASLVGGVYRHSWVEIVGDGLGAYRAPESARLGSTSVGWLRGLGGAQIATDTIVWALLAGYEDGKPYYDAVGAAAAGGGTTVTVREVDLTPTGPAAIIEFDQTTGIRVTGVTGSLATVANQAATDLVWGVVTTSNQTFAGKKTFKGGTTDQERVVFETWLSGNLECQAKIICETSSVPNGLVLYSKDTNHGGDVIESYTYLTQGCHIGVWINGIRAAASYKLNDSAGALRIGQYATTGGLTFAGGLYVGGTATGGMAVGGAVTGSTAGNFLTVGAGGVLAETAPGFTGTIGG